MTLSAMASSVDAASLDQYYTIDESQFAEAPASTSYEEQMLRPFSLVQMAANIRVLALNLLRWTLHSEAPTPPQVRYNRTLHFGRWINDPSDDTCYNTRAKVLLRDTEGPISYRLANHCVVDSGRWQDPYTARTFNQSREIQIDHMVPLKDAYMSGAWEWNYQTRCLYANFMGNKFHLISSNGIENMRKGDRAPDEYMPPNREYHCQYLENWLKIKLIWKLKMTASEVDAIKQGIEENGCNADKFSVTDKELAQQRNFINNNIGLCPAR